MAAKPTDLTVFVASEQPADDDDAYEDDEDFEEDGQYNETVMNQFLVHNVMQQGDIERLRVLLPADQAKNQNKSMDVMAAEAFLLEKDAMGCLPIHIGVIYQQTECVLHLLRYSRPLASAMLRLKCSEFNTPFVHLLLRIGALLQKERDDTTTTNATTTKVTVSNGRRFATDVCREMFGDVSPSKPLEEADFASFLLEQIKLRDDEGNSVLHICAMNDLSECLELLVRFYQHHTQGIDGELSIGDWLQLPNRVGFRVTHLAMKFRSLQVLKLLLNWPLRFQQELPPVFLDKTHLQQTPLHLAALADYTEGIQLVLKTLPSDQIDLTTRDFQNYTASQLAEQCGFDQTQQLLNPQVSSVGPQSAVSTNGPQKGFKCTLLVDATSACQHLPNARFVRGKIEPPPENLERIETLVHPVFGVLHSHEFRQQHIVWDQELPLADIGDVLRVHEYHYVQKLQRICHQLESTGSDKTFVIDSDTSVSCRSYQTALRAAGAVCKAVDLVLSGESTTAFCVVRPPGHHAGPVGKVVNANDPEGSNGFCLLNNVAIGAAYARSHFKRQGVERIAIVDFDVHHGNGTQEIVRQLVPQETEIEFETCYGKGKQIVHQYKPWRNDQDAANVLFCSAHGYGPKDPVDQEDDEDKTTPKAWFYPGSGVGCGTVWGTCCSEDKTPSPLILNAGLEYEANGSISRLKWRQAMRDRLLKRVVEFGPDLILLSSGFDAHRKESVNWGYCMLLEQDYEWLLKQIKRVAMKCCQGRVISVLEGGYNVNGLVVSPFARSVAAHLRELANPSYARWSESDRVQEEEHENQLMLNMQRKLKAKDQKVAALNASAAPFVPVLKSKKRRLDPPQDGCGKQEPAQDQDYASGQEKSAAAATAVMAAALPMAIGRSKRTRKEVDYVALEKQLTQETKSSSSP